MQLALVDPIKILLPSSASSIRAHRRPYIPFLLCLSVLVLVAASTILAWQVADAQSIQVLDPTVRSAGMGGVSSAIFWEPMSASWTNPAALGYQRGLSYEWSRTESAQLPGWSVTGNRLGMGDLGIGLLLAGEPADALGGVDFEDNNDEHDLPEGDVRSFAFGVNIFELSGNILNALGHSWPGISRYGDVSLGMAFTSTRQVIRTSSNTFRSDSETSDYGVLFRLTPYNSVDYPGLEPGLDELLGPIVGGLRIDAAYGFERHDYSERAFTRFDQKGGSLRFSSGALGLLDGLLSNAGLGWLSASVSPFLSFGIGWDDKDIIVPGPVPESGREIRYDSDLSGWELSIANIFTIRRGGFGDLEFDEFTTKTDGWGLGFKIGDYGSFRYDRADDENNSTSKGVTVNVNAMAIFNALRAGV